jgi:hypothetical protein
VRPDAGDVEDVRHHVPAHPLVEPDRLDARVAPEAADAGRGDERPVGELEQRASIPVPRADAAVAMPRSWCAGPPRSFRMNDRQPTASSPTKAP